MSWARRPFEVFGETAVQVNAVLACAIQHAAHDGREKEAAGSPQVPCCLGHSHMVPLSQKLSSDFSVEGREKPVIWHHKSKCRTHFPMETMSSLILGSGLHDKILRIAFSWAGLGARSPCITYVLWAMCS